MSSNRMCTKDFARDKLQKSDQLLLLLLLLLPERVSVTADTEEHGHREDTENLLLLTARRRWKERP